MRLTMKEKKKLAAVMAPKYQKVRKKDKGDILKHFITSTGYNRCYAAYVLRTHGRKQWINTETILVGDVRKRTARKKERVYDDAVTALLTSMAQ